MKILGDAEKMLKSLPAADFESYTELIKDDYKGYIFYHRERNGDMNCECSACGGKFNANYRNLRTYTKDYSTVFHANHNDFVRCPLCGKVATLKCKGRIKNFDRLDEYRYYAFCEAISQREVLIRCYAVGKLYYRGNVCGKLDYRLDSVYILQPGEAYKIANWGYGYSYQNNIYDPFLYGNLMGQKYMDYDIFGLDELDNTFLKYSQINQYVSYIKSYGINFSYNSENNGIKFIRYLCMYAKYPSIEMFIKLGFTDAVISLVQYNQPNKRLFDWEADNAISALRCKDKQEFNEVRGIAANGSINFVVSLKTLKRVRKIEPNMPSNMAEVFYIIDADGINTLEMMMQMSGKTLTQCANYLIKQMNNGRDSRYLHNFEIGIWKDYITAATKLGYDLSVANVVLPKNLREAHDHATATVQYEENKEKFEFMKNLDKARRKKYEYSDGELMIRLPISMQEIIDEGKALSHCVGGYADRHADGKTTILFLRRCDNPDEPYYTVEINGNTLMQYHGYANERTTNGKKDPQVVKFVEKWHKWVKAGSRPRKTNGKAKSKSKTKLSA